MTKLIGLYLQVVLVSANLPAEVQDTPLGSRAPLLSCLLVLKFKTKTVFSHQTSIVRSFSPVLSSSLVDSAWTCPLGLGPLLLLPFRAFSLFFSANTIFVIAKACSSRTTNTKDVTKLYVAPTTDSHLPSNLYVQAMQTAILQFLQQGTVVSHFNCIFQRISATVVVLLTFSCLWRV